MSPYWHRVRLPAPALVLAVVSMHWVFVIPPVLAQAQPRTPSVALESLLDTAFHATGIVRLDTLDIVFAPAPPVEVQVQVIGPDGQPLATFPTYPEYKFTSQAFGRLQVVGPAEAQLTTPGKHELRVLVQGKLATVLPFSAAVVGGEDPFAPGRTWRFDGPWRRWGYLLEREVRGVRVVDLVYWVGAADLAPDQKAGQVLGQILFDGKVIAHSNERRGHIADQHFKRDSLSFFRPHDAKEPNPTPFGVADLQADGRYELRLTRQSDQVTLRSFPFEVKDGTWVSHPRTALGHEPAPEYIAPRVVKKGSNVYEFVPAVWLESK